MSKKTQPIHVTRDTYDSIKALAAGDGITIAEAAAKLVSRAIRRKAAVDRYNAKRV